MNKNNSDFRLVREIEKGVNCMIKQFVPCTSSIVHNFHVSIVVFWLIIKKSKLLICIFHFFTYYYFVSCLSCGLFCRSVSNYQKNKKKCVKINVIVAVIVRWSHLWLLMLFPISGQSIIRSVSNKISAIKIKLQSIYG